MASSHLTGSSSIMKKKPSSDWEKNNSSRSSDCMVYSFARAMDEAALELRTILESAERAASEQDFASAEHHLRRALALQETQLGFNHPDLANTLNNLGIVSERVGNYDDNAGCYS